MLNVGDVLNDSDFLNQALLKIYTPSTSGSYVDGVWQEALWSEIELKAGVQVNTGAIENDNGEGRRYNETIKIYLNTRKLNIDRTAPEFLKEGDFVYYRNFMWEIKNNNDWSEGGYYVADAVKSNRKKSEFMS